MARNKAIIVESNSEESDDDESETTIQRVERRREERILLQHIRAAKKTKEPVTIDWDANDTSTYHIDRMKVIKVPGIVDWKNDPNNEESPIENKESPVQDEMIRPSNYSSDSDSDEDDVPTKQSTSSVDSKILNQDKYGDNKNNKEVLPIMDNTVAVASASRRQTDYESESDDTHIREYKKRRKARKNKENPILEDKENDSDNEKLLKPRSRPNDTHDSDNESVHKTTKNDPRRSPRIKKKGVRLMKDNSDCSSDNVDEEDETIDGSEDEDDVTEDIEDDVTDVEEEDVEEEDWDDSSCQPTQIKYYEKKTWDWNKYVTVPEGQTEKRIIPKDMFGSRGTVKLSDIRRYMTRMGWNIKDQLMQNKAQKYIDLIVKDCKTTIKNWLTRFMIDFAPHCGILYMDKHKKRERPPKTLQETYDAISHFEHDYELKNVYNLLYFSFDYMKGYSKQIAENVMVERSLAIDPNDLKHDRKRRRTEKTSSGKKIRLNLNCIQKLVSICLNGVRKPFRTILKNKYDIEFTLKRPKEMINKINKRHIRRPTFLYDWMVSGIFKPAHAINKSTLAKQMTMKLVTVEDLVDLKEVDKVDMQVLKAEEYLKNLKESANQARKKICGENESVSVAQTVTNDFPEAIDRNKRTLPKRSSKEKVQSYAGAKTDSENDEDLVAYTMATKKKKKDEKDETDFEITNDEVAKEKNSGKSKRQPATRPGIDNLFSLLEAEETQKKEQRRAIKKASKEELYPDTVTKQGSDESDVDEEELKRAMKKKARKDLLRQEAEKGNLDAKMAASTNQVVNVPNVEISPKMKNYATMINSQLDAFAKAIKEDAEKDAEKLKKKEAKEELLRQKELKRANKKKAREDLLRKEADKGKRKSGSYTSDDSDVDEEELKRANKKKARKDLLRQEAEKGRRKSGSQKSDDGDVDEEELKRVNRKKAREDLLQKKAARDEKKRVELATKQDDENRKNARLRIEAKQRSHNLSDDESEDDTRAAMEREEKRKKKKLRLSDTSNKNLNSKAIVVKNNAEKVIDLTESEIEDAKQANLSQAVLGVHHYPVTEDIGVEADKSLYVLHEVINDTTEKPRDDDTVTTKDKLDLKRFYEENIASYPVQFMKGARLLDLMTDQQHKVFLKMIMERFNITVNRIRVLNQHNSKKTITAEVLMLLHSYIEEDEEGFSTLTVQEMTKLRSRVSEQILDIQMKIFEQPATPVKDIVIQVAQNVKQNLVNSRSLTEQAFWVNEKNADAGNVMRNRNLFPSTIPASVQVKLPVDSESSLKDEGLKSNTVIVGTQIETINKETVEVNEIANEKTNEKTQEHDSAWIDEHVMPSDASYARHPVVQAFKAADQLNKEATIETNTQEHDTTWIDEYQPSDLSIANNSLVQRFKKHDEERALEAAELQKNAAKQLLEEASVKTPQVKSGLKVSNRELEDLKFSKEYGKENHQILSPNSTRKSNRRGNGNEGNAVDQDQRGASNNRSGEVDKNKKKSKSRVVWEIEPLTKPIPVQGEGDESLVTYLNHRKCQGWKMEFLILDKSLAKSTPAYYAISVGCYKKFPKTVERYLVQHNLHQENSKYKWRKLGYNSDPRTKANLQTHDFDDFTDIPKYLERIKNHGKDKKPKSK